MARSCSANRMRRTGIRGVLISAVLVALPLFAQELREQPLGRDGAGETPNQATREATAPNQSISIEEISIAQANPKETEEDSANNSPASDVRNPSIAEGDPSSIPLDAQRHRESSGRSLRRRPSTDLGLGIQAARSAPWYRTGLGALFVVLGLIGGLYVLARKWLPAARVGGDDSLMRVVGRTALSPRQSLALVRVGRRFVVVGMSPDRVDAVCEITDSDEVNDLFMQANANKPSGSPGFANWLNREAADYVREDKETGEGCEPIEKSRHSASKPLTDLLHRLRAAQSSRG